MKHLKLFENRNQEEVWVLHCEDIFVTSGYYQSFRRMYFTQQDAENWFINYCNNIQDVILSSNDYTDDAKAKYGKYILDTFHICDNFIFELVDEYGHDDLDTYIDIRKEYIESVELSDEVKMKLDAKKYNL